MRPASGNPSRAAETQKPPMKQIGNPARWMRRAPSASKQQGAWCAPGDARILRSAAAGDSPARIPSLSGTK
ncbi:Os04g0386650 [Oryza sativa Japonica Group]|uniref:Os04g0386650 protein n=1 Tax=Oryza sativa subsp. japonica TaxID=39947 RepID=A0A0P0WA08_ORYSJ|nr:Os04g0386650 [Oryza sativa Japonica Group]